MRIYKYIYSLEVSILINCSPFQQFVCCKIFCEREILRKYQNFGSERILFTACHNIFDKKNNKFVFFVWNISASYSVEYFLNFKLDLVHYLGFQIRPFSFNFRTSLKLTLSKLLYDILQKQILKFWRFEKPKSTPVWI
jgi:hypothetical protein